MTTVCRRFSGGKAYCSDTESSTEVSSSCSGDGGFGAAGATKGGAVTGDRANTGAVVSN